MPHLRIVAGTNRAANRTTESCARQIRQIEGGNEVVYSQNILGSAPMLQSQALPLIYLDVHIERPVSVHVTSPDFIWSFPHCPTVASKHDFIIGRAACEMHDRMRLSAAPLRQRDSSGWWNAVVPRLGKPKNRVQLAGDESIIKVISRGLLFSAVLFLIPLS